MCFCRVFLPHRGLTWIYKDPLTPLNGPRGYPPYLLVFWFSVNILRVKNRLWERILSFRVIGLQQRPAADVPGQDGHARSGRAVDVDGHVGADSGSARDLLVRFRPRLHRRARLPPQRRLLGQPLEQTGREVSCDA